jgi:hypothetical protein
MICKYDILQILVRKLNSERQYIHPNLTCLTENIHLFQLS